MAAKTPAKAEKPKRKTKREKIAFLKRSAAAKLHWHRKRERRALKVHAIIFSSLFTLLFLYMGSVAARAADLVPPAGPDYDSDVYIRAAQADRPPNVRPPDQVGRGSWYALGLRAPDALTCASTRFPRGTRLEVTNLRNGRKIVCLVNDYGPQPWTNRVIDLSRGSYRSLDSLGTGTMPVEIRVVY